MQELNNKKTHDSKDSLKVQLDEKKADFESKADSHIKKIYKEGIDSVQQSGVLSKALKIGDIAPNFILNNAVGAPIALYDLLNKGKVILTWYRGGWCPYCNLTLLQLQKELSNFKTYGAQLLALTPELPDNSLNTSEKNNLKFEVLSDVGNKIAEAYGILFKLTDEVAKSYNKSFDLNNHNGDKSNELPLAATYIIDKDAKINYVFLDADYRNRAEPSELTRFLKTERQSI